MNIANGLSFLRIILSILFCMFYHYDRILLQSLGVGLFIIAALTDLVDGYMARTHKIVTHIGKHLDPLADKFLTSIGFICISYIHPTISLIPIIFIIGKKISSLLLRDGIAHTRILNLKRISMPSIKRGYKWAIL